MLLGSTCLWGFVCCSVVSCGSKLLWGLCCSLLAFSCLRVGALLACGVSCASSLRSLQSMLPFVVCPPFLSLFVLHLLLWWVGWSQVCGGTCCSCVWSSGGVSVVQFCHLGLLSHPLLLLFLVWVSAFGVCSLLCPGGFCLAVPTVWLSRLLAFSSSLLGFFPLASSVC